MKPDIRDDIFRYLDKKVFRASLISLGEGIIAGHKMFIPRARALGLDMQVLKAEGARIFPGEAVILLEGTAKQIALAEERVIGWLLKASGIATAASHARRLAEGKIEVISGAWKKMPFPLKHYVREAIKVGGIRFRICEDPFIYLDKNYVAMLGGIKEALIAIARFESRLKVIQLKSHGEQLAEECRAAVRHGADILMIDTGQKEDITVVSQGLYEAGLRSKVKVAYSGNIRLSDLIQLREQDLDIVDIGRAIVDAPLLDMKLDVLT